MSWFVIFKTKYFFVEYSLYIVRVYLFVCLFQLFLYILSKNVIIRMVFFRSVVLRATFADTANFIKKNIKSNTKLF